MPPQPPSTRPGAIYYNPLLLAIYDLWVLHFNMRYIWRCPTPHHPPPAIPGEFLHAPSRHWRRVGVFPFHRAAKRSERGRT
ncbi:hypothetical protein QBC34DRAFT_409840 [Podospora aff. communis PSN243]|uniref:Uncharacterized protein n=1 Tax=Podospora aff. communis PSN243 TaxID=3040156 RepID=A0AAV9GGN0_9PEZI|nr:hypothetical protein QBC34DRAFT_409840 [Podospora aff. communis PSN243]